MNKKLLSSAFLVVLIGGFMLVHGAFFVVQAATNVTGIIYSDVTWTEAGSPYVLTGPVAVNIGVTLTVESGVTVDLNGYYIQVNGTLIAVGSSSNWIQFKGGELVFKPVSTGWNEQTDSGSQFEYANFSSTTVSSSVPLKVNHCQSDGEMSMGGSSLVSDSSFLNKVTIAGSCRFLRNNINSSNDGLEISSNEESTISDNTINTGYGKFAIGVAGGSSSISNNEISGGGIVGFPPFDMDGTQIYAVTISSGTAVISNNHISGGVSVGNSSSVTNNVFVDEDIHISDGSPVVSGNIFSDYGGITVGVSKNSGVDAPVISNNRINYISIRDGSVQVQENTLYGTKMNLGIVFEHAYQRGKSVVTNNYVYNCCYGLGCWSEGGTPTVTFQKNYVVNCQYGMTISGGNVTILSNSLINNYYGIYLSDLTVVEAITYNNIQDSEKGNLVLNDLPNDINATYNWWGTTDTEAISQSIHDFEDDFNLGKVTFVPFSTESNPEAQPDQDPIPESIPTPTPSQTPAPSPTPTTSPAVTPTPESTPTPTQEPTQIDTTTITVVAIVLAVLGAGLALIVYIIKRK